MFFKSTILFHLDHRERSSVVEGILRLQKLSKDLRIIMKEDFWLKPKKKLH
jgi:hypothetical protein